MGKTTARPKLPAVDQHEREAAVRRLEAARSRAVEQLQQLLASSPRTIERGHVVRGMTVVLEACKSRDRGAIRAAAMDLAVLAIGWAVAMDLRR